MIELFQIKKVMSQEMFQKTKYLVKYVYEQYNMKRMFPQPGIMLQFS